MVASCIKCRTGDWANGHENLRNATELMKARRFMRRDISDSRKNQKNLSIVAGGSTSHESELLPKAELYFGVIVEFMRGKRA